MLMNIVMWYTSNRVGCRAIFHSMMDDKILIIRSWRGLVLLDVNPRDLSLTLVLVDLVGVLGFRFLLDGGFSGRAWF